MRKRTARIKKVSVWFILSLCIFGWTMVHGSIVESLPMSSSNGGNQTVKNASVQSAAQIYLRKLIAQYRTAVQDAVWPRAIDIDQNLWLITEQNKDLSWKVFAEQVANSTRRNTTVMMKKRAIDVVRPFQSDITEADVAAILSPVMKMMSSSSGVSTAPVQTRNVSHVLMTTLVAAGNPFREYVNGTVPLTLNRDLWLTAHPQVQNFCRSVFSSANATAGPNAFLAALSEQMSSELKLMPNTTAFNQRINSTRPSADSLSWRTIRLLQYLGLPPVLPTNRIWFVSFWVKPSDLIRPCPNPDISNPSCSLTFVTRESDSRFTARPLPSNGTDSKWFISMATQTSMFDSMASDWSSIYPWTRLGYTMDWSGDRFGPTEFVVRRGTQVRVESVRSISDYCK